ncbi:MAG: biopolymer transporter ExbD [Candidatus Cloacimonetes bacterium]|nr:biopolymer transporter ExbD [Candidatus Cloacimonadota bacterium]MCF7814442.1 biopolymer transporter ExbD [Candidatus Cloacimonadota bacterium]MCF7868792.1 biopolymer transporter ExbD [Candidatus Cloacimonadota bacterium]
MKKLSYVPIWKSQSRKSLHKKKSNKTKDLNITSLIDILTILLVFIIKNVSMDASEKNVPKGMLLPTTITKNALIESGQTIIIKIYPDQILYGKENVPVGSLQEFVSNKNVRTSLLRYMKLEADKIKANDHIPCLLIQGDKDLDCKYITEFIKFSAQASFANIYFSTIHTDEKNEVLGIQG